MKNYFAIAAASGVSRDGILLEPKTLISAYFKFGLNGTPSCLGHDSHNLVGWNIPSALLIESERVLQSIEMHVAESIDDEKMLKLKHETYLCEKMKEYSTEIEELDKLLLEYGYIGEREYLFSNTVSARSENIVKIIDPSFSNRLDNDGLVNYRELKEIVPGVFELNKDFVVFAHQYFRRRLSLQNNINVEFFSTFKKLISCDGLNQKIKIDSNLIGLNRNVLHSLEFDYWYGPKFDDDLATIRNGVCSHKASDQLRKYAGILETNFQWKTDKEAHKVLEMEELLDQPSLGINEHTYGLRYVHSMVNIESKEIIHLDGAIRAYESEKYLERIDVPINRAGKQSIYTKLWRIDGVMDISLWKKSILDFYRDNTLIGEYFGINTEEEFRSVTEPKRKKNFLETQIPYSLLLFEDIKIGFQKISKLKKSVDDICIHPINEMTVNGRKCLYIEADAFHIVKLLKSRFPEAIIAGCPEIVAHEDLYINMPLIEMDINLSVNVINVFQEVLAIYNKKNERRGISINLIVNCADDSFVVSLYGSDIKLKSLFDNNLFIELVSNSEKWAMKLYEYASSFNTSKNTDVLSSIINSKGYFEIKRNEMCLPHSLEMQGNELIIQIDVGILSDEDLGFLKSGMVKFAPTYYVQKSKCSKCNCNYLKCGCNVLLDDNVSELMTSTFRLQVFWTDMKA